jgi:hypothetical protein
MAGRSGQQWYREEAAAWRSLGMAVHLQVALCCQSAVPARERAHLPPGDVVHPGRHDELDPMLPHCVVGGVADAQALGAACRCRQVDLR